MSHHTEDDAVTRWLADQDRELVADLTHSLDLDAGLMEVLHRAGDADVGHRSSDRPASTGPHTDESE